VQWARHVIYETIQVRDRPIRVNRQLLERLIESVHPHRGITERLCTGGIPASSVEFGGEHFDFLDRRRRRQQLCCARKQGRCDRTSQMRLSTGLVRKRVEDAEARWSKSKRKPHSSVRLALNKCEGTSQEVTELSFFTWFGFEAYE
jgi:hypothetical protein